MDITTDKQYFFYLQVQYNIVETRFSNCIIQHDKKNADMNTFLAYSSVKWKQASLQSRNKIWKNGYDSGSTTAKPS